VTRGGWRPGRVLAWTASVWWAGLVATGPVAAQNPPPSSLVVRLITIGPGPEVWERFGHNALWLSDSTRGIDVAYDYGRFSFSEPDFLGRFVRGDMRYWMAASQPGAVLDAYRRRDRSIWIQELDLPPSAREALLRFLEWNTLEENRFYRYDYYRDNCSTRLRDALDRVLDGAIARQVADSVPGSTWRYHSDRLLAPDPLAFTGTKLGLANPADQAISRWDEMYVPMKLQEHLRSVVVLGADGTGRPLVAWEGAWHEGRLGAGRDTPPGWYGTFLGIGLLVGALLLWSATSAARGKRVGRVTFGLVGGLWAAFTGIGSLLLLYLWLGTDHLMTRGNENVLQLSPLALPLLVLLPLALTRPAWSRTLVRWSGAVAAVSVLGVLIKVVPGIDQANWQILATTVPVNVALFLGARRFQAGVDA